MLASALAMAESVSAPLDKKVSLLEAKSRRSGDGARTSRGSDALADMDGSGETATWLRIGTTKQLADSKQMRGRCVASEVQRACNLCTHSGLPQLTLNTGTEHMRQRK